jgi:dienelactone hydrolase
MTRRVFTCLAAFAIVSPVPAQEFKDVPKTEQTLRQEIDHAPLELRFDGKSADDLRAWQAKFKARLDASLGPYQPPKKWETIVEGREELDGFTRERLVLVADGHPRLPVYRLLPRPLPEKRCAGIVAIHGHGGSHYVIGLTKDGKEAGIDSNDYGRDMARRGYIVTVPVMVPFPPRTDTDVFGKQDPCGITFLRMQLLGKLLIAENLRDCLWALELLAQDPRVDAKRLGCIGLSYGGRMTMLTTAVEPRIRVAAISGALNVMQERVSQRYSCGAQVIPGLLKYGDVPEIGSLIAPRPVVWEVGAKDALMIPKWVDIALERMGRAYDAAGAKANLQVDRFDGGHRWNGHVAVPLIAKTLSE